MLFTYANITADDIIDHAKEYKKQHHVPDELLYIDESKIKTDVAENEKFVNNRKVFVNWK